MEEKIDQEFQRSIVIHINAHSDCHMAVKLLSDKHKHAT